MAIDLTGTLAALEAAQALHLRPVFANLCRTTQTALTGHCPTLRNAAVRPVEGDIRCTSEINRQANSQIADKAAFT